MHALARLVIVLFATGLAAACTDDPSAQYFPNPPTAKSSPDPGPNGSAATAGAVSPRLLHGAVARPDPKLTPGLAASTDLTTVCRSPKRVRGLFTPGSPLVSPADQQAIFDEYHITAANAKHYGLDFLIPLQLGGARARSNIWPASTQHGVGFHEKEVLNIRLHDLVCRREMPLDQAQKGVASDWVKLWLLYG